MGEPEELESKQPSDSASTLSQKARQRERAIRRGLRISNADGVLEDGIKLHLLGMFSTPSQENHSD